MSLDVGVPGGDGVQPGFSVRRAPDSLGIGVGAVRGASAIFGVTRDPNAALINVFPSLYGEAIPGWTAYIYHESGEFSLKTHAAVQADVLCAGGGGSGGGGWCGGGGGAGGFTDLHDVVILGGTNDGRVTVGAGGGTVVYAPGLTEGHPGGMTSFGDWSAFGGGYGGGHGGGIYSQMETYPPMFYRGFAGGSAGGDQGAPENEAEAWAYWWEDEHNDFRRPPWFYYGTGSIFYGWGTAAETIFRRTVNSEGVSIGQGNDGGTGVWWTSNGARRGGGGGGAWWPATDNFHDARASNYGRKNGGLGRPCDIAGWYQLPGNTELEEIYREAGWRYVPWFCGGGAGAAHPNDNPPSPGAHGYGGVLANGAGGGGGGRGHMNDPNQYGDADGGQGEHGVCIIRIRTADENRVAVPAPTGADANGVPTYDVEGLEVRRIPANEPHTDEAGNEPIELWGLPGSGYGDDLSLPAGCVYNWGDLL